MFKTNNRSSYNALTFTVYVSSPSCCLCWSSSNHVRTVINWFLVTDPLSCQIMNWCNKQHHIMYSSFHITLPLAGHTDCTETYSQTCITRIKCPWMLLSVIPRSPLTLPSSLASLTRVPAGGAVAGSAASRDIMEQQQHHCNNTATAKQRLLSHSHFIIVWT